MANGKAKGSAYEREIAKFLTEWASGQIKKYWYWRSPSSGAIATISKCNEEFTGDIISIEDDGRFLTQKYSIEIKNGYPLASFHKHLKDNKNDDIKDFWVQCCRDAISADKRPMLIFRKKGFNAIVGVTKNEFERKTSCLDSITMKFKCGKLPPVEFFDMKEFFSNVLPEDVKGL